MGIWIRSQDRKYLANVNFVWINNNFAVIGDFNNLENTAGSPLGKYRSEAEALQVVDMIQGWGDNRHAGYVFQMPEAGFGEDRPENCPAKDKEWGPDHCVGKAPECWRCEGGVAR